MDVFGAEGSVTSVDDDIGFGLTKLMGLGTVALSGFALAKPYGTQYRLAGAAALLGLFEWDPTSPVVRGIGSTVTLASCAAHAYWDRKHALKDPWLRTPWMRQYVAVQAVLATVVLARVMDPSNHALTLNSELVGAMGEWQPRPGWEPKLTSHADTPALKGGDAVKES